MTSVEGLQTYYFETGKVDSAEAAQVLSQYVAGVVAHSLNTLQNDEGDITAQIQLVNCLIDVLGAGRGQSTKNQAEIKKQAISQRGEMLLAVVEKSNNAISIQERPKIVRPVTSIANSSLFTGALYEPSMFHELKKEILSADRIDMLVSFIKWSGLRLIYEELKEFTRHGLLRIITTSYMGATDSKAVEMLQELPNTQIKISYDTQRTRLHAKAYVFFRENGFTTAYVGSSNMSNAALSSGLEWNVKVAAKDQPATIKKMAATFDVYWNDGEFQNYGKEQRNTLRQALRAEKRVGLVPAAYNFAIRPYDYQKEILDKLAAEREVRGHYKNLVVAATGTGKTVVSAFDYQRFRQANQGKPNRLLFIAHREEILEQSIACFRGVLQDQNFGDLFVGSYQPESIDYLFMSVQTFNARGFTNITSADFYDYIIVDEFHHAAAASYQKLLSYYQPRILLGLTATPERMDGRSILTWFDNRIAAEIRLPEAIDRRLLCPFQYFGVADNVDLSKLRWTKGGYDKIALQNVYTGNRRRAELIVRSLTQYITDMDEVKGLGFCASVDHAVFMANYFNTSHIPSLALTANSRDDIRKEAKQRLANGEIRFIFVVDLYNEGVDIPAVNTILFLRPTESLTVFLQQLGRGLRLFTNKECLTILDFIGQAHTKYNFAAKIAALMTKTGKSVERQIKDGFLSLPRGSFIQLEKMAKDYILSNIRSSVDGRAGLVSRIATFTEDTGQELSYCNFIAHYQVNLKTMYPAYSFARLCAAAGVRPEFQDDREIVITKALARVSEINSRRWILFLLDILPRIQDVEEQRLEPNEKAMLLMLYYTIYQKPLSKAGFGSVAEGLAALQECPVLFGELIELLAYNYERIDFIDQPANLGFACPLDLYCSYSRDQLLTALGNYTDSQMPAMFEGVKYLPEKDLDILLVTLNKSDKDYSPSTMYDDYSINDILFHWQSQSTTSEQSSKGQRYINHRRLGKKIVLFVREFKSDKSGACPYTFLGLVDYVSHTGSRPMSITWRLHNPIPAKFVKKTNKLTVG